MTNEGIALVSGPAAKESAMELRQLEALVTIAREGSFTRASDVLAISQPSLSARIRRLERSLNCQLIDRHTRPVRLTVQGKAFLPFAERVLFILEAAEELVQRAESDEITIGGYAFRVTKASARRAERIRVVPIGTVPAPESPTDNA